MNKCKRIAYWIAYRLALVYWRLVRPTERGAYVAVWLGDELLLIENSYKPRLTFPAGGLKRGETALAAAVRELGEEVGIKVEPEKLQFVDEYKSTDEGKIDFSSVFELRLSKRPEVFVDSVEVVRAEFVPFSRIVPSTLTCIARQYVEAIRNAAPESNSK